METGWNEGNARRPPLSRPGHYASGGHQHKRLRIHALGEPGAGSVNTPASPAPGASIRAGEVRALAREGQQQRGGDEDRRAGARASGPSSRAAVNGSRASPPKRRRIAAVRITTCLVVSTVRSMVSSDREVDDFDSAPEAQSWRRFSRIRSKVTMVPLIEQSMMVEHRGDHRQVDADVEAARSGRR